MSVTTRLLLPIIDQASAQKEQLINQSLVLLDNAALVTIANTFAAAQYITQAPTASVQFGNLNVGNGGFTGGAGHYSGGAGGSLIAVNLVSGGTADLLNLQINGVSKWKLGSGGNVTLGDASNMVLGTGTGSQFGTGTTQKLAFYGVTPVAQQPGTTDLRAGLIALGLFGATGAMPLNTNGGDLVIGALAAAGTIGGSGTPVTLKRVALTLASSADYTLAAGEKDAFYIDVQSGSSLTTTTNIIVPGAAGGTYNVYNRHATQSVVLKTAGNPGITVPALRNRVIGFLGGTTAFSWFPANDYSV